MKQEDVEICREAFDLYKKGYRIDTRPGKNKGEYTAFQIRLEDETRNAELFKKLKKIIPQNIIKQVDTSSRRCFLIIGKNYDLIDGIVSYVLYASKFKARLLYENCIIENGERIRSLFGNFVNGDAVFLRNVSEAVFKQISEVVRDHERRDWHSFLFVSAEKQTEVIPGQFKPIYLETHIFLKPKTNSIIVNGRAFETKDEKDYLIFKLMYDNQDRYVSKNEFIKREYAKDENDLFKRKSALKELFRGCPFIIDVKKETMNKEGGYRLIIE